MTDHFRQALALAARGVEHRRKLECYRTDIALWAKERLGIHLWSKQVEIAKALVKHKKVAVKSCHASGKSYSASIVIAWWVDTHWGQESVVVSTAPTYEQVNKILWRYLRRLHAKHDLPGRITQEDEWKNDHGDPVGFGRKPSDTNQHGFQGIHDAQGVLAVLDEACGLAESIWSGVKVITTGEHDRILAIANPDDPNTELGKIFREKDNGWHKITISAFDTPNFTGEPGLSKEALGALIQPSWVEEAKRDWGEESARYQSKVLGQFPTGGVNTLFSVRVLSTGDETTLPVMSESRPRLGVDVARFGDDYTTVYSYQDGVVRLEDKWAKADIVETALRVTRLAEKLAVSEVRIDGVGIGAGVLDIVTRNSLGRWHTIGMVGNAASPDLDKWGNARAYWYDTFREDMLLEKIDLDPEDSVLHDELGGIEYKFNNRGAVQIESKDDMKKRGIKSPDFADAAMYAAAKLQVDPEDPAAKLRPGEIYELALDDILMEQEQRISIY